MTKKIQSVVIATGISSVVTQLLAIREFLSLFNGNEFIIALILFAWLLLGGVGTLLAQSVKTNASFNRLCWISIVLAALSPMELFAIRALRDIFFIHGTSIGFYPTLAYIFITIAPYCLLLGFVLPYSLIVAKSASPDYSGTRIYIFDNIGDISGGALFSFALVFLVTPFKALFIANLPLLYAVYRLYSSTHESRPSIHIGTIAALGFLMAGIMIETTSLVPSEGEKAYYKESRYGRIKIIKDREQYTLFVNGQPMFSNQNTNTAEEIIHYPLSQLKSVSSVLMISAQGGVMQEVAKYRPSTIDYVEIDPDITDVVFRFGLLKKIPGLNIINQDGRAYLKDTNKVYDAVIINLPEPDTFQINRFFTDRFFYLAKQHLAPGGILSFHMKGFDSYISDAELNKISSLYHTVHAFFKNILLLPGNKIFFLCRDKPLNPDIPALLDKKNIMTNYIKGYYYGNVTNERIERLNNQIIPDSPLNREYSPQLIRLMFSQWFSEFATSPAGFMIALLVLTVIYLVRITKEEFVLFSTGCVNMGSEILVIFAFQIFFGYIYLEIGLIITVFLAGLLPGAMYGESLHRQGKQLLVFADGFMIMLLVVFIASILLIGDHLPAFTFLLFGFAVSLVCGCQFPVALYLQGGGKPAAINAFSADLIGAAFGTLLTSIFLIPYVGILWTAAGLIILKIISLMVIQFNNETHIPKTISII